VGGDNVIQITLEVPILDTAFCDIEAGRVAGFPGKKPVYSEWLRFL
jgi:hypothetical protein